MKNVITLTTDFGLSDHYVGAMKGVILSINPDAFPIDVTHSIDSHDIRAASFAIANSYSYFPPGTVHMVVVDPGVGGRRRPIAVCADGHFFVGPDNGVFSSVFHRRGEFCVREITNRDYLLKEISSTFHGRDIFSPVAAHLSLGISLEELGPKILDPEIFPREEYSIDGNEIRGTVVYADKFGNLVTSIPTKIVKNRLKASVRIGERLLKGIYKSYCFAAEGEILAVEGSSGYVEISVNRGSARDIFGKNPRVFIIDETN